MHPSNVRAQQEDMDPLSQDPLVVLSLFSPVYLSLALKKEEGEKIVGGRGSLQR